MAKPTSGSGAHPSESDTALLQGPREHAGSMELRGNGELLPYENEVTLRGRANGGLLHEHASEALNVREDEGSTELHACGNAVHVDGNGVQRGGDDDASLE